MNTDNKQDHAENLTRYALAFIGGAAAGLALGLYLNSDRGRETRSKLADKISDLEAEMEDKIKQGFDDLAGRIEGMEPGPKK